MKGLLLINLGTPQAPTAAAVRRYLREFLMDERVLDIHPVARWALVNLAIVPFRSPKSAAAYESVWMEQGSPLLVHGQALAQGLSQELGQGWKVALGMRYGLPSLEGALAELQGVDEVLVLPLYPQYASSSTASCVARVMEIAAQMAVPPPLRVLPDFYELPAFVQAQAALGAQAVSEAEHVLFSYHGLPERQLHTTSPSGACLKPGCCEAVGPENRYCYKAQCMATTRALQAAMGLDPAKCSVSFQSRLGNTPWIQPFTDQVVPELARSGVRTLAVLTPSFVADCLETLEEIGDRAAQDFVQAGGERLIAVPCVNASSLWVRGLARWLGELS